jgi:hypothetical protein
MQVRDLIGTLRRFPPDLECVMTLDEGGVYGCVLLPVRFVGLASVHWPGDVPAGVTDAVVLTVSRPWSGHKP